jgi:hypothetical protein
VLEVVFSILLPKGSYLKLTVPPLPGSETLVSRFSKSQLSVVVPEEEASVWVLPFASYVYVNPVRLVSSLEALLFQPELVRLLSRLPTGS